MVAKRAATVGLYYVPESLGGNMIALGAAAVLLGSLITIFIHPDQPGFNRYYTHRRIGRYAVEAPMILGHEPSGLRRLSAWRSAWRTG